MDRTLRIPVVYGILLVIIIVSCAQEGFPPGGPTDTFPPYIVSTRPPTGSTDVPVTVSPVITFNERMNPQSIEESIFIAPVMPFTMKSNWGGNAFTLHFERPLDNAQTYVITVGTGARDIRGNRLTGSVVLALSTGSDIDTGEIAGVVASDGREAVGAFVWAYNLGTSPTADPATTSPDYIVQTGQGGRFAFSNLSPGRYRVFAFLDQGRDRRYDPGQDPLGVPTTDVTLTAERSRVTDRRLELAVRDTSSLALVSLRSDDATHLRLRFSRPVDTARLADLSRYRIVDQRDGTVLTVLAAYRDPVEAASVTLVTAPQVAEQEYTLTVVGLLDMQGRPVDTAGASASFTGSGTPDTTPPTLRQTTPPDSAVNVPLRSEIRLTFSEAVQTDSGAVTLRDPDGRIVDAAVRWDAPVLARIRPALALQEDTGYRIMLFTDRIRDLSGNAMRLQETPQDTVIIRFTTVDPVVYGQVSGTVSDDDSTATGAIGITLTDVRDLQSRYEHIMPAPGTYRFDEVLPGAYTISAYRDANGDGRLTTGSAVPFVPAERTTARLDTVIVRSMWESEQVDLRFRP